MQLVTAPKSCSSIAIGNNWLSLFADIIYTIHITASSYPFPRMNTPTRGAQRRLKAQVMAVCCHGNDLLRLKTWSKHNIRNKFLVYINFRRCFRWILCFPCFSCLSYFLSSLVLCFNIRILVFDYIFTYIFPWETFRFS